MKRILILCLSLVASATAFSQVIFSEDFDGIGGPTAGGAGTYTFPAGWLLRNVDNVAPNASVGYVNDAWERREDFSFNVADSCAFSTSWTNPAGTANDWMWTPPIAIQPNTVLKWNAVTYDAMYPDGYEVRIMSQTTTPGGPTGGSGVIGNQITNSTVLFSTAAENTAWTARQVSLNAYAGQTVWIAFRNNSNDKFLLLIDDVVAEVQVANDLRVNTGTVGHGPYTVAPSTQLTTTANIQLTGNIQNIGTSAATNAALGCRIYVDGNFLTSVQSATTASLASGANETKTINYTPTQDGVYDFDFYPIMTQTDLNISNDTISDPNSLIVDAQLMRRDDGTVTGGVGIGAGVTGYVGHTLNIETPVYVESISVYVTRGYVGRPYSAVIYNTNGAGVPTTLFAATDTLFYPDDSADLYTMPMSAGSVLLPAGKYAFMQVEHDSTLQVGQTASIFRTGTVFAGWTGQAFTPVENFGASFAKPFVIWPNFDVCYGETGGTLAASTPSNCGGSTGTATVTLDPGYSVLWSDGQTTTTAVNLQAGVYTYTMESAYCSFTDTVIITNPNSPTVTLDAITAESCLGDPGYIAVTVSGGTAPYNYTWSDSQTTDTLYAVAGTYNLNVTDAAACTGTLASLTIPTQQGPSVSVENNTDALCNGDNGSIDLAITGGNAPYDILWSDNSTDSLLNAPAGVYNVTVTDANGCDVTLNTLVIFEPSALAANETSTDETCMSCNNGTAEVAPTGGTSPYTYLWSNGATTDSIGGLAPGTYDVTITDDNGCTETVSVTVTAYDNTGLNEFSAFGLTAYPNPVTDFLIVASEKAAITGISLTDLSGREVKVSVTGNDTYTVDMRSLAKGSYHLHIQTAGGNAVTTITKQ